MARNKQPSKHDPINKIPSAKAITPKKFSFSGDLLPILFCVLYFDRVKLVQKILAPPTILNHLFNIFM